MSMSYTLNHDDVIVAIRGGWDSFALENDAERCLAHNVMGRQIWEFVSGFETRNYLNAVFYSVRNRRKEFSTRFRCDSAEIGREFRMHVKASREDRLHVSHELVSQSYLPQAPNVVDMADKRCEKRCSMCCRFEVGGIWIDPFATPPENMFPKSYTICPECRAECVSQLGGTSNVAELEMT